MPTLDPNTGAITLSMEEFQQMNSGGNQNQNQGGEAKSLADRWKEIFSPKKPEPQNNNNPNPGNPNPAGPQKLTREAVLEASKGLNFFQPTQEQLQKIQAGDMSAMIEAQNDAMRKVFADSTMASNTMLEHRGTSSKTETEAMMREMLNRHDGAREIQSRTQDYLGVPGGDVLVSALTSHFSQSGKSAAEVGELTSNYLKDFTSNFGQQASQPSAREVAAVEAEKSATDF